MVKVIRTQCEVTAYRIAHQNTKVHDYWQRHHFAFHCRRIQTAMSSKEGLVYGIQYKVYYYIIIVYDYFYFYCSGNHSNLPLVPHQLSCLGLSVPYYHYH